MALPLTVRVKLSSEAAGAISLTPVVMQELPLRELLEHVLAVTGKDQPRICETLARGSMVSGASRFRWPGWTVEADELRAILADFPDADPARPFQAANCRTAILRGGRKPLEIAREAAERKGLFQRRTFWEELMSVASAGVAAYAGYSYRDRADRYVREFSREESARICAAADRLKFQTLRDQVRSIAFTKADLLAGR